MSVITIRGNLFDTNAKYICHQVNCQRAMNSGLAKQIRYKWPEVYLAYDQAFEHKTGKELYSHIQIVPVEDEKNVINMFSQFDYGRIGRYTSYDAFWNCLNEIKEYVPEETKIAFPYKIGCGLGGADWDILSTMINKVLAEDYEVEIWYNE